MNRNRLLDHIILVCGALFMLMPVWMLFASSTHDGLTVRRDGMQLLPGGRLFETYMQVLFDDALFANGVSAADMLVNSFIVATGFAVLCCAMSLMATFALVYFRLRLAGIFFSIILITLYFPIETRILPTYLATSDLGLLNSYAGLILPLTASGLGTLFFRQVCKTVPDELLEAARLDGAGPVRFFIDILVPAVAAPLLALFAILFVLGWNQYLWPLMVTTGNEDLYTIVRGIERAGRAGHVGMGLAILAVIPPGLLVLILQRRIVGGLVSGS